MSRPATIKWNDDRVMMIDQTLLPGEVKVLEISDYKLIAEAIKSLRIRGAPAIGIAGAFGIVLGSRQFVGDNISDFKKHLEKVAAFLAATRPTAVNLEWAIRRMMEKAEKFTDAGIERMQSILLDEAEAILNE
ncbi:MAG: S-methyl-5-thioribose-1-phosphate isomerase, partial [Candidatus Marinimicrobia bacterium]|nr:S-methyl-5-thioribose-1-phosphate isomerase [Candidatus Neomarinimicrobiota bacterium]